MKNRLSSLPSLAYLLLCAIVMSFGIAKVRAQSDGKELKSKAPKPYVIQATGYKTKPISAESKKGKESFEQLNCTVCHSIHNTGGVIGPLLDGIGARKSSQYLYAHLADTEEQKILFSKLTKTDINLLVHPRVSELTAKYLVTYLETLPEPPGGFVLFPHISSRPAQNEPSKAGFKPMAQNENSMAGKALYDQKGCTACHSINNIGGWLGPRLDGIGGRKSRAEIFQYINSPSVKLRESTDEQEFWPQMPRVNLSQGEINKIIDYLLTLPNPEDENTH